MEYRWFAATNTERAMVEGGMVISRSDYREPIRELEHIKGRFVGYKPQPHKGDEGLYKIPPSVAGKISRGAICGFDPEGKFWGRQIDVPAGKSPFNILYGFYANKFKTTLTSKEQDTFNLARVILSKEGAIPGRKRNKAMARVAFYEGRRRSPRFHKYPPAYIYKTDSSFSSTLMLFKVTEAYSCICNLQEPFELTLREGPGLGNTIEPPQGLDMWVGVPESAFAGDKIMSLEPILKYGLRLKQKWDEPFFMGKEESRAFLALGAKIMIYRRGVGTFGYQQHLCTFETPTAGVCVLDIIKKGSHLYRQQIERIFSRHKSAPVYRFVISTQMLHLHQCRRNETVTISIPSFLPKTEIVIGQDFKKPGYKVL